MAVDQSTVQAVITACDEERRFLQADGFLLVISYNPGYQSALKDLKQSTRQRFIAIEFDYPPRDQEAQIIAHEAGIPTELATELAKLGEKVRNLREHGISERYGSSKRDVH